MKIPPPESLDMNQCNALGLQRTEEQYCCRITVVRKDFRQDLYQQHPYGPASSCGRLEVGQVFETSNRWDPPEGLCPWAWSDLQSMIHSIHAGHKIPYFACCSDGLRPVTFKVEGIERTYS